MKPTCQLSDSDGNVFALMGRVSKTLKRAGLNEEAKEMCERVFKCKSYDEALKLMMEYVEVE